MTFSHDDSFRSITGVPESAEPAANSSSPQPPMASLRDTSTNKAQPPASASDSGTQPAMRYQTLNGSRSLNVSGSPSTANSPLSSRDTSPARPPHRQQSASGPLPKSGLRSRKSSADVSPSRGPSLAGSSTTIPSAAAIQRALSSANIPQLPPTSSSTSSQEPSRVPRPLKPASGTTSGESTPHWPISPRLKSPPPAPDSRSRSRQNSLRTQPKKAESSSTPSIVVQSSSPAPASRIPVKDEGIASDPEEPALSMKVSSRGASGAAPKLETVQEASLPTSPGFDGLDPPSLHSSTQSRKSSDDERNDNTRHPESGSDGGINKRSASTQRSNVLPSKASFSSLSTIKSQTETRSASGRGDGSLRLKPSNETIRPKKEKSKPKRKAPSINSGTGMSPRAHISYHHHHPSRPDNTAASSFSGSPVSYRSCDDRRSTATMSPPSPEMAMRRPSIRSPSLIYLYTNVFEKKVASATFVYESNPDTRARHHHSRTPSMTSINSLVDPRAVLRSEANRNPNKKTSMKFATHSYNNPISDPDAIDRGEGTNRIGSGRVSGGSHHHHISRHGHGRGTLNHVIDSDSSFAQPSRARNPSSRQSSQPSSPKFHNLRIGNGNGAKKNGEFSAYDLDAEHAADDERTPLISGRNGRARTPRRPNSGFRPHERQHRRNGGWCRRFAGCLVLSILVLVLIFSAVGLVFASTKPLYDVKVREIQNVIASQEEIMLDLVVDAINPNIIGVTIADMDVNIFAKSKHVGSDKWWREHGGNHRNKENWHPLPTVPAESTTEESVHITNGIDEGTDPISDPEVGEPRIMLLGRIFHFDSPLNFDGSFLKRNMAESLGELRVTKPGNKTEAGGTERWEEVLQYPFELIVRGVFKYQLPLSTREHTIPITASYYYDPDQEKKKVKALSVELDSRTLSPKPVSSKPLGRYHVRGRPLLI
ncbi:uncharacterized protein BDR25DRAFT_321281 [Lindgomyces ingoldianus]|uniref:Uncharacterized protein n=1 Tax=Lindgomyces ingoldianus TaxID=673940 RepID=A0ACB6RGM1_9PLEO|nr:uncharacterized protein BDR25DRAFT_321281 [Lindgomyces ingoldianus]KAF2478200.1 hypothetical protein BDR25DRAFT_321281 [Lindgomyces ingoldianus]